MKKRFFGILLMGAMVIASMSMFTSCKDYDDDINSVKNDVTALRTELATLKTTLTNDLSTAKSQLESAIAAKASATDLANLAARVAALETKIAAIDNCASKSDVEALATTIATLTGDITTLQAALAAKANSTDLEAYAKVAALQAAEANIALQQAAITSLQTSLESLASKVEALSAAKGDKEAIENLQNKLNSLTTDLNTAKATLATATADVATVKTTMNTLSGQVSDAVAELNVLTVLVNKKLTSIVLRPEFYAHGIEAIEVINLNDTIFDLQNAANKGKITELWGIKGSKAVSKGNNMTGATNAMVKFLPDAGTVGNMGVYDYNPVTEGFYHINPVTAELKDSEVKFYTNIAQDDWTRAGYDNLATPEYAKIDADVKSKYYKDGILEVPFSVDRDALNHIIYRYNNNGTIAGITGNQAFISLSLSKKDEETSNDTIVTSDYAMLSPADYKIVALAGTWLTTNADPHKTSDDHLWYNIVANQGDPIYAGILYNEAGSNYYSPITAFTDAYKLPVVYNQSIDLKEYVKTHYQYRSVSTWHNTVVGEAWSAERVMSDALMAKLGLHYEFEAIHYLSGSNRTDEWEHIQLDGSVAYPRSVTNEGKQIPNEVATREVIGREPLVRVTLVNEAGDVLQVGYILLQITSTAPSTNTVSIDFGGDYYMNCTANADITWAQVEADILRAVGMSKAEFEASYSLETTAAASTIDVNYNNGTTTPTQADVKTARQYYWTGAKWASIDSYNAAVNANASLNTAAKKRNAYIWPLGSVYEVVNTGAQQTTVLRWTVGSQVIADWAKTTNVGVGTTDQPMLGTWGSIERALAASGANTANKGISQNPLSVTVAYKMKDNGGNYIESNAIYVTLNIPATKLHFAYAEISGKDLSLWYQNNSYLNATQNDESDAIEVHLNVPTPAAFNVADPVLTDADFEKALTETFVSNLIGMAGLDATHFNQFNTTNFGFKLVKPVKGTNATDLDAAKVKLTDANNNSTNEYNDAWIVNGVTGAKYILQVNATGTQINAVAWINPKTGNAQNFGLETKNIVTLDPGTSEIRYAANRYAQDILNYSGRLNQAKTDLQTSATEYLGVEDKTFTAFIQITQDQNKCYNLLMPNSYFKARWLRPINVYSANKEWTDALNTKQVATVAELVGVNDWRNMAVNGAKTGASNVNAKFYGIADSTYKYFYVDKASIYTDHHLAVGSRTAIPASNVAAIEALKKTSQIPALANVNYFNTQNNATTNKLELFYVNTEANVGTFHLYVPIYVTYAFGEWAHDGTKNTALAVPADPDPQIPLYTQKVYAVITVKQTTNSSTQARKN